MPAAPRSNAKRWARRALIAVALIALVGVGATLALRHAFPPERLAALVTGQVSAATGRDFAIRGPLSLRLLPTLAVVAEDVHLANVAWGTRADMLAVRKVAFDLALWPLLGGALEFRRIGVEGADLWLETDAGGRGNWVFEPRQASAPHAPDAAGSASGGGMPRIALAALELQDMRLTLHSARLPGDRVLHIADLELHAKGDEFALDARLDFGGPAWLVEGEIGGLAALAANADRWPFDLRLRTTGLQASAKGALALGAHAGDLRLEFSVELRDAAALHPWFNATSALPLPIRVSAMLQRERAALKIAPLEISLAGQTLKGELIEAGATPMHVQARLAARKLDLGAWLPAAAASTPAKAPAVKAAAAAGPIFSHAYWALPGSLPLALDLVLAIDELRIPSVPPISSLQLQLKARPDHAELASARWTMAQGQADASARIDLAHGGPPRMRMKLDARELSVDALARAVGPRAAQLRNGRLRLSVDLSAKGDSAHALASSADGQILLSASGVTLGGGAGALSTDLLVSLYRALAPGRSVAQDTLVKCAVVRLPLRQGVATIDRTIALETDQFDAAAVGRLDLGRETVSLALRPSTRRGLGVSAADLSGLVRVEGPLRDPKLSLDPQGTLREAAKVGAIVATGGMSIVAERWLLKGGDDANPCQRALGASAAASPGKPASAPAKVQSANPLRWLKGR